MDGLCKAILSSLISVIPSQVYGQNYKHENTHFIDRTGHENTQYYLCCEDIVPDHLTAQLLRSCFELFWHGRFPHDVAQMHHVQTRN